MLNKSGQSVHSRVADGVQQHGEEGKVVAIDIHRPNRRTIMNITKDMEVIGADGVHVGTVDGIEANRIRLSKKDSGEGRHKGHRHFIDMGLVADVEGNKVRLSAIGAVAVTLEDEK
jgi:hypothetical protein